MTSQIRTVKAELLIKANQQAAADFKEYGSAANTTISVITALAGEHSHDEMEAVSYRLFALAKLVLEGDGEHWTLHVAGEDYKLIDEALFRAAARAPLQAGRTVGETTFDAQEFLNIAMEEAKAVGSA
jgi:hypothetical protein